VRGEGIAAAVLFVVTVLAFAQVASFDFVPYDDDAYVTENPRVRTGLSAENLAWALTTDATGYRHPATWVSHQADAALFGLDAGRHHLGNVVLHAANAVLVLLLFARTTRRLWPSLFVAGVFALHPLRVESVAWVSQRKDVLSAFFGLAAMLAHVRYARAPTAGRSLLVAGLFTLALLSKPMLVTLPLLLLLLDVWPLDRLRSAADLRARLLEKVPLFVLSLAAGLATLVSQAEGGSISTLEAVPWSSRLANAFHSLFAYLGAAVRPVGLAVLYPFPEGVPSPLRLLALAGAFLLVTALLVRIGLRRRVVLVGWLWYVVALLPVLGIVSVGVQARADRYTYLALLGPSLAVAFLVDEWARDVRARRRWAAALGVALLLAAGIATWRRLPVWKDGETLFRDALEATSDNHFIRVKYATLLDQTGRSAESLPHFEEAIRLRPRVAEIRVNFGNALTATGDLAGAVREYDAALALDPDSALAHYNRAVAHSRAGEDEQAREHYLAALRIRPDFAEAHCNLGCATLRLRRPADAVGPLESALRLSPGDLIARRHLAEALALTGRREEAIRHLRALLVALPSDADAWKALGLLLESQGRTDEARAAYRRALDASPSDPSALDHLRRLDR
jgi:tetratricopeptide (TPR) repeat protein